MTTIPRAVVRARRTTGVILVLSALATVIMLVTMAAQCSTQSAAAGGAPGRSSNASVPTASVSQQPPARYSQQPSSPQVALQQQVDADRPRVEALVGSWVPQLSSKTVGPAADGTAYDYGDILDHVNRLKVRYPRSLLLRSDDYTSFKVKDYWVIVMPIAYSNGAEANSWCDSEGIDPDNCFAKLLLHTGGPDGATMLRK